MVDAESDNEHTVVERLGIAEEPPRMRNATVVELKQVNGHLIVDTAIIC